MRFFYSVHRVVRGLLLSAWYLAAGGLAAVRVSRENRPQILGCYLARYFISMGPLHMKLGQVLATRSDLISTHVISELRRLHDQCRPSSEAYIRQTLSRTYGSAFTEVFEAFDFTPLASGSIAQVHSASLKSGERVAVKIIKKSVRPSLAGDLRLLRALVGFFHSVWPPFRAINVRQHFHEIEKLLETQVDLDRERRDQEEIRESMSSHPFVRVPLTYPQFSTQDVLVMDFVNGIPARKWREVAIAPSILAQRLDHALISMLHNGVFHADPHPGNVFFTSDGTILPVDFGLVGRLTKNHRRALSSFLLACAQRDWIRASRRLVENFVEAGEGNVADATDLVRELAEVLHAHFGERARGWSTFGFVNDGRTVLQRHQARLTTAFTQVAFMAVTGEGFLNQLDPEFPVWDTAKIFSEWVGAQKLTV